MTQRLIQGKQVDITSAESGAGVFMPPGGIIPYAGATEPAGYVFCNGGSYNPTERLDKPLFQAIGYTYTSGSPSFPDPFDVPDLQGRVVVMEDGGTFASLGTTIGSEDAVVVSHTHTEGTLSVDSHDHGAGSLKADDHNHGAGSLATDTELDHQHGDGANAGLCIVAAGTFCGGAGITNTDPAGEHEHDVTGTTGDSGVLDVSGSTGDASPDVTGTTSDASSGVSGTQQNIQPSFTLNYIISLGI